eukprot:g1374.t1
MSLDPHHVEELHALSRENNHLRRSMIQLLEQDRRDWETQPQTQQLLSENEDLRAANDALELFSNENVNLQDEIAERQARIQAASVCVERQRDDFHAQLGDAKRELAVRAAALESAESAGLEAARDRDARLARAIAQRDAAMGAARVAEHAARESQAQLAAETEARRAAAARAAERERDAEAAHGELLAEARRAMEVEVKRREERETERDALRAEVSAAAAATAEQARLREQSEARASRVRQRLEELEKEVETAAERDAARADELQSLSAQRLALEQDVQQMQAKLKSRACVVM